MRRLFLLALAIALPGGGVAGFDLAAAASAHAAGTTPTTTNLTSSPNPSIYGQSFTVTATISPTPTDGGTVTFSQDGTTLFGCTQPVTTGQAGCVINMAGAGAHTIVAAYQGDAMFAPSTASIAQTVTQTASGIALTSSADPSVVGQSVTFEAISPPGSGPCCPTGTVDFTDNGSPLPGCTALPLSNGVATCAVTYGALGNHSVVVSYPGDPNFTATSVTLGQTVAGCDKSLVNCDLAGANLAAANLARANLSRANLRSANLSGTNLSGSILKNATLNRADLSNANLAGANVKGASFYLAVWSNTLCPDGTNSDTDGGTCVKHLA